MCEGGQWIEGSPFSLFIFFILSLSFLFQFQLTQTLEMKPMRGGRNYSKIKGAGGVKGCWVGFLGSFCLCRAQRRARREQDIGLTKL